MSQLDSVRPKIRYKRLLYPPQLNEVERPKCLIVRVEHAMIMLGVGRSTLYSLLKDGSIKAYKLQGRTVFLLADLKKFIADLPPWEPRA